LKRIIYIAIATAAASSLLYRASAAALVSTTPAQDRLNNFGSTLGYEFTPNSALSISALGFSDLPSANVPGVGDGLEQERFVGLWDSNGVPLTSVTVPAGTVAPLVDGFRYWSLQTPITLEAGHTYILGAYYNRESDDHYTLDNGASSLATLGLGRSALGRTFPDAVNNGRVFGPNLLAEDTGLVSHLYEIASGSYIQCCGIGGDVDTSLPNESQRFIRLTIDAQRHTASMTFLGEDRQTVFSIVPCPPTEVPIPFDFDFGLLFSNRIVFHVDPGPPPYGLYWNYTVSNSTDRLRIDGVVGMAQQQCIDVPTRFSHSNVVAVLTTSVGPRMTLVESSTIHGTRLLVQGQAGRTNVIEASTDLIGWTPVSTNVMPYTLCPVCPFILFEDTGSTNLAQRLYRCFEVP
jgi:hypothetical protein